MTTSLIRTAAIILLAAETTLALASTSGPLRAAKCELYEHRDYGGARATINNGNGANWGTSGEGSTGFRQRRTDWNDIVSSVRVPHGCRLTVFEHDNGNGDSRTWDSKNILYVGDRWNDRITSASCWCD